MSGINEHRLNNQSGPLFQELRMGTKLKRAIDLVIACKAAILNQCLSSPGLSFNAGAATIATANDVSYVINGKVYTLAAGTQTPTAAAQATAKWCTYLLLANASGFVTGAIKCADQDTSAAAITALGAISASSVALGYILVHNTSGSNFTLGTTNYDATNITTTFVNYPDSSAALLPASPSVVD